MKEALIKQKEKIEKEKENQSYLKLQPINACNNFNPLNNESLTECYHNVAHQI